MESNDIEYLRTVHPQRYRQVLAERYGLPIEGLELLLADFELLPIGVYEPSGRDRVDMTMTEIAEKLGLQVKAVGCLQNVGAIGRPITYDDLDFLRRYLLSWGNHCLLRLQLTKLSQTQREDLMKRPELNSKWERWAYAQFLDRQIEFGDGGRMLNPEDRISIRNLARRIEEIFNVPDNFRTHKRLQEIRQMVWNDRKRAKTERVPIEELARRRSVPTNPHKDEKFDE